MNPDQVPYVHRCTFCHQGLLRLWQCSQCCQFLLMCDECDLLWKDVAEAARSPEREADGCYPVCPICEGLTRHWIRPSWEQIQEAGLDGLVTGWSS